MRRLRIRKNAEDGNPYWVQDLDSLTGCGFVESCVSREHAQSVIDTINREDDEEEYDPYGSE